MHFSLLNKSHNHLLTYGAFEQVRRTALRHCWLPNSISLNEPSDQSEYALEFRLALANEDYYLYIPWNVEHVPIRCHVSSRTLADNGYA